LVLIYAKNQCDCSRARKKEPGRKARDSRVSAGIYIYTGNAMPDCAIVYCVIPGIKETSMAHRLFLSRKLTRHSNAAQNLFVGEFAKQLIIIFAYAAGTIS